MEAIHFSLPKAFSLNTLGKSIIGFLGTLIVFVVLALLLLLKISSTYHLTTLALSLLIIACFFVLLLIWISIGISKMRLELFQDGIILYGWGYKVYTPWDNIVGIAGLKVPIISDYSNAFPGFMSMQPVIKRNVQGLRLEQEARRGMRIQDGMQQKRASMELSWWNPASTMRQYAQIVPVPAVLVNDDRERSELGAYLKKYAPRLPHDEVNEKL